MKILVTGTAGFIGFHTAKALLDSGHEVIGLDNINSYYDTQLKYDRLAQNGIVSAGIRDGEMVQSTLYPFFRFLKADLNDRQAVFNLFAQERFDWVIHLAAQAGVRYSIDHPYTYIDSNLCGFMNILEACRHYPVQHLLFASSSSVYGMSDKVPFREDDTTDRPVSLYAATKKANEVMAYSYAKLYGLPVTGLRFFTVYGPWGRPDMAPFLFMKAITEDEPIRVFNNGELYRDFTYIDDVVKGMVALLEHPSADEVPSAIYNIGNSSPVALMDFIATIEQAAGKTARKIMVPMQPGDVYRTYADTTRLQQAVGYRPSTTLQEGIDHFYRWYAGYFGAGRTE